MGCSSSKDTGQVEASRSRYSTPLDKKHEVIHYAPTGRVVHSPLDTSTREIRLLRIIDPGDDRHQHSGFIECDLFQARLPQTNPDSIREYLATEESMTKLVKHLKESNMDFSDLFKVAAADGNLQTSELMPVLNILPSMFPGLVLPDELKTDYSADTTKPTTHFFTALSYCWGDAPERHEVRINGCPFMVGTNLHEALKQFQLEGEFGSLWIDAICINQEDVDEKSSQLVYMRDIYSLAFQTIIWLGVEEEDSNLALDFAQKFEETIFDDMIQQHISAGGTMQDDGLRYDPRSMDIARILHTLDQQLEDPSRHWKAVFALLSRPWFSRIWTMQEVVLARLTKVQVGGREVTWDKLKNFVSMLYHRKDVSALLARRGLPNFNTIGPKIVALSTLRGIWEKKLDIELSALVAVSRGKSATKPQDYVYGLLGLATDNIVVADYSLSVEDTFIQTTKAIIDASQSLDIICFMNRMSRATGRLPSLPSWVYNFGQGSPPNALLDVRFQGHALATQIKRLPEEVALESCNACGSRPVDTRYSADSRTLTTSGVIFDTIVNIGYVLHGEPQNGFDDIEWPFDRTLKNQTSITNNPYETDEKMLEAIWRTLTLNKISREHWDRTPGAVDKIWPLIAKPCTEAEYVPLFRLHLWYKHNHALQIAGCTLEDWCKMAPTYTAMTSRGPLGVADMTEEEVRVLGDMSNSLRCRKLAVTKKGFVAIVPYDTRQKDVVAILDSLSVPIVLRAVNKAALPQPSMPAGLLPLRSDAMQFQVLGGAYVHGIMNGEGVAQEEQLSSSRFNISLI